MACACRLNAAPTMTLAPPSKKTRYHKKVRTVWERDCCGRLPKEDWELIKRDPPIVTSSILGNGGWYSSGDFRTAPSRVCLYEGANTFSLVNADNVVDLEPSITQTLPDTICGNNSVIIFQDTDFFLITPDERIVLSPDFYPSDTIVDILRLPRSNRNEYLIVVKDGTLIWVNLEGTELVEKQTLATGIANVVAAVLSFKCLECATQRYTFQCVDNDDITTAFALWRVNDKLSVASDSFTTGSLTGLAGELTLATDQVRLQMVGALQHGDVASIFLFEPTKSNLYSTLYYQLYVPFGDSIIHMEACNNVIDIVLDNSGWIRIKDGKALRVP